MAIQFHSEGIAFNIKNKLALKRWIASAIEHYDQIPGNINIIFCSDEFLLDINRQFLDHDYYTDIVTFDYCDTRINGDLFISIDRVQDNATKMSLVLNNEIYRVIIHGVLHLLGQSDKTEKEQAAMRAKENEQLEKIKDFLK